MGGCAFLSNKDAPIFNISYLDWMDKNNYYLFKNNFEKIISEEKISLILNFLILRIGITMKKSLIDMDFKLWIKV